MKPAMPKNVKYDLDLMMRWQESMQNLNHAREDYARAATSDDRYPCWAELKTLAHVLREAADAADAYADDGIRRNR